MTTPEQNVSTEPDDHGSWFTVGELRDRLENYHDATPVLVDGYESGFDDIGFRLFRVKHDPGGWWAGAYDEDENGVEVLVLQRVKRNE